MKLIKYTELCTMNYNDVYTLNLACINTHSKCTQIYELKFIQYSKIMKRNLVSKFGWLGLVSGLDPTVSSSATNDTDKSMGGKRANKSPILNTSCSENTSISWISTSNLFKRNSVFSFFLSRLCLFVGWGVCSRID